jgi:hypothetical protein
MLAVFLCMSASAAGPAQQPTIQLNNGLMMPVLALGTGGYDNATVRIATVTTGTLGAMQQEQL